MSGTSQHKYQAPKGTRDFYPADMAVRRYIESVCREVSINHGFEEIDGPTFEHLELYTVKSGPGIVNELFSFRRAGGESDYALRPEFTPTLARMYAAQAGSLPRPTKWFSIRPFYRAERPQRGRLREFLQWNVDILGDESPKADAEVIACAVAALERFGLTPSDVKIRISDRRAIAEYLTGEGVCEEVHPSVFELLDRASKMPEDEFTRQAASLGLKPHAILAFAGMRPAESAGRRDQVVMDVSKSIDAIQTQARASIGVIAELDQLGLNDWCKFDFSIVRGLAYYTGTVFEVHETSGQERAIAGGGRYDKLVELFGGPPTPACGFAMGDVVLTNLLRDKGLLRPAEEYLPRPDVFVIVATDEGAAKLPVLVAQLRRENLHVRHSYKTTRNVGKLLTDASKARARFAVILGKELEAGNAVLKDLDSGEQRELKLEELGKELRRQH